MAYSRPALLAALALTVSVGAAAQVALSENTMKAEEGAPRPAATIADVGWLAGYWRGPGLGGDCEEIWSLPAGDRMQGIFTLSREGALTFSEAMTLVEEEGSLVLKVKHFTPEFVGWEEKEDYVSFPLVKLGEDEAWFRGLTFRRRGADGLSIFIVLTSGGEKTEHELKLERVAPAAWSGGERPSVQ